MKCKVKRLGIKQGYLDMIKKIFKFMYCTPKIVQPTPQKQILNTINKKSEKRLLCYKN